MSLFLKPQLKFYPQFRNAKPEEEKNMSWRLFIFREHSTRELASSRVTYFILRAYAGRVLATANTGKTQEKIWEKMQVNGPEG